MQEEVVGLLKDAMAAKFGNIKGFVIDSFPANLEQAKLFEDMIGAPTKIVVFEVNAEVMKIRLRERSNFDDKPESILKRIETFTSQTRPVIKQYAKAVISVSIKHPKIALNISYRRSILIEHQMLSLMICARLWKLESMYNTKSLKKDYTLDI